MGILAALEFKAKVLEVYGDSALVVHQLRDEWETRDSKLIPYHSYIKNLMEQFEEITFHHIPREENQLADALATLSSMFKISQGKEVPLIRIQNQGQPAYCQAIEEEPDGKPWFYDIKRYLKDREYPPGASENDKKTLRRLAMRLAIFRAFVLTLLIFKPLCSLLIFKPLCSSLCIHSFNFQASMFTLLIFKPLYSLF
uniref:RNase H type-1 domain-containing protein n=1 Tax=Cajanus cajan TaxID=3821 RepID=A0A151R2L5_CAJCA|nr:hypothetical protein KK1_042160 [Cajanus cajan]